MRWCSSVSEEGQGKFSLLGSDPSVHSSSFVASFSVFVTQPSVNERAISLVKVHAVVHAVAHYAYRICTILPKTTKTSSVSSTPSACFNVQMRNSGNPVKGRRMI